MDEEKLLLALYEQVHLSESRSIAMLAVLEANRILQQTSQYPVAKE